MVNTGSPEVSQSFTCSSTRPQQRWSLHQIHRSYWNILDLCHHHWGYPIKQRWRFNRGMWYLSLILFPGTHQSAYSIFAATTGISAAQEGLGCWRAALDVCKPVGNSKPIYLPGLTRWFRNVPWRLAGCVQAGNMFWVNSSSQIFQGAMFCRLE